MILWCFVLFIYLVRESLILTANNIHWEKVYLFNCLVAKDLHYCCFISYVHKTVFSSFFVSFPGFLVYLKSHFWSVVVSLLFWGTM